MSKDHQVIPDAAVESAAKWAFETIPQDGPRTEWASISPALRDETKAFVLPLIQAAAPYMMAEAWDEGAESMVDEGLSEYEYSRNPYRKDML